MIPRPTSLPARLPENCVMVVLGSSFGMMSRKFRLGIDLFNYNQLCFIFILLLFLKKNTKKQNKE